MTTGQCPCGHDGGPRETPHHSSTSTTATPPSTTAARRLAPHQQRSKAGVGSTTNHAATETLIRVRSSMTASVEKEGNREMETESGVRRQAMARELGEGGARQSVAVTETLTLGMGCARTHRRKKSRSTGRRRESVERAFFCALARRRR